MKKVTQQWDDMLLELIDGTLDDSQRAIIQDAIAKDPALQQRFQALQLMHDTLRSETLQLPSKNFTLGVINRLHQQPEKSSLSIRNSLFLLGGVVLVMLIAVTLLSAGVFDQSTTIDLNSMSLSQKMIRQSLPTVSIDGKWLVNGIVLLNLIIAFLVLDRAVLKPFFQRRLNSTNFHS